MNEQMIAPCGLNCAVCKRALAPEKPCPGCLGESENKPEFCARLCGIRNCRTRAGFPDRFCDQCERFPCGDVMEKEIRYANAYPLIECPIGNLAFMRQYGMEALIARETQRWTCPDCGGTIAVQTGVCAACGKAYSDRTP